MTVELQLSKPDPTLSGILTLSCFDIVPKRVVQSESESQFESASCRHWTVHD